MFMAALFVIAKTKQSFHWVNDSNKPVGYLYHGILLSDEKEQSIITCNDLDKLQIITTLNEKVIPKGCTVWFNLTFLKWQNYRNGEQMSGFCGVKEEIGDGGGNCICGSKALLWEILWRCKCSVSWLYPCHILVVKLCSSFTRCYHWRKLVKGTMKFCIILL